MDMNIFEICFLLAFVGIGIVRGLAKITEENFDKVRKVISDNIPQEKWNEMCKKTIVDSDEEF